jgi:hypothetical protein
LSERTGEFDCEKCTEELRRARNCGGEFEHRRFAFQIGKIKEKTDLETKTVYECPRGLVGEFEDLLWRAYQDTLFKKEFGMSIERMSSLKFEAFKVLESSCNEYNEWHHEQEQKKLKIRRGHGRRA